MLQDHFGSTWVIFKIKSYDPQEKIREHSNVNGFSLWRLPGTGCLYIASCDMTLKAKKHWHFLSTDFPKQDTVPIPCSAAPSTRSDTLSYLQDVCSFPRIAEPSFSSRRGPPPPRCLPLIKLFPQLQVFMRQATASHTQLAWLLARIPMASQRPHTPLLSHPDGQGWLNHVVSEWQPNS